MFNAGDVVQLKSGGPEMTVDSRAIHSGRQAGHLHLV